ncbi:ABC transporter permease [Xinfangfangia sp. CPCC 101601]|uniref:ABC transporter permease n=1 Tax=Pseudogemmobacter lacusdianii TaxID=3069608 RepID=A0ABU0W0U7_9RHOB|nr:ABC transporter permease [Xinfangfangia sp. CPCC 101601]MDQ2067636.1 ABC transporter permease [Xinfangfangia sp. CPCC 101601]
MFAYAMRRLGLGATIILVAMMILFSMIYLIPGDPASVALGPRATPEMIAELRSRMGLDDPVLVQFWNFVSSAVQGNLGVEALSGRPVLTVVMEQLPFTLAMVLCSITWAVLLGIPLGCIAAVKRGGFVDRVIGVLSVAVIAVPSFVVAIYALLLFAVHLKWLPAIGAGESGNLKSQLMALILPSLAVGLGWIGYIARLVRASMLETLEAGHIRTARAFGLPERWIIYNYALRIAILPTVTLLGVGIGHMLSSSVFAEIVFARPGIGKLVYEAISTRNYPLVTGAVLVTTAFFVLVNVLADLVIGLLDPRVRASFN